MAQPSPVDAQWLEHAPLALGVIRGARLIYINERMATLLGAPRPEIEGRPIYDFVAPSDRDRIRERHTRRERGESVPESYELTVQRADGATRAVEIFVSSASQEGDWLFQLVDRSTRSERSENLHALARLGASVQMHQSDHAVFDAMGVGLSSLGVSWVRIVPEGDGLRVIAVGASSAAIEQCEAAIGRPLVGTRGEWMPGVLKAWNEGAAYLDDVPLTAGRFFADATSRRVEEIMRATGLLRGVVQRLDASGEPTELLFIVAQWISPEDLPAFSLFTAQVSAALDAARVISDLSNRNSELAALNRVASAAGSVRDLSSLFGVGAGELVRVLGCVTVGIYLVDDKQAVATLAYEHGYSAELRERYSQVLLRGELETLVRTGGASVLLADVQTSPERKAAYDELGLQSVGMVGLIARSETIGVLMAGFRGIATERGLKLMSATAAHFAAAVEANRLFATLRSSYATLAHTQQQLVHRERLAAIGELAAVVAHEVRNPLGVIFNSVGAIRRIVKDDIEARTIIDILDEEANRLNHIVGDLLDFARPATPSLHTERIDLVLDAATEAALGESRSRILVERDYEPGIPALRIDERLMRQALINVVLNAVQSMPTGGHLRLRIKLDGNGVKVEVGDTGPGIPPDVRPRIFEPFFTTRATGTGLGLAVVKRIIDGHRGDIHVATDAATGTVFTLRIPFDPDEAPSVDSTRLAQL